MADENKAAEQGASETTETTFSDFEAQVAEAEKPVTASPATSGDSKKPVAAIDPEDPEDPEDEEQTDDGESEDPADPPKKKVSFQQRINDITKARREAERRAEAAERELAQLRATPKTDPEPKTEPEEEPADTKTGPPKPDDYQFGELDSQYIQDLVDYRTDLKLKEAIEKQERQFTQRQQHATTAAKVQAMRDAGSSKYDDFEEKVFIGAEKGEYALSEDLGKLLVESDAGADIAYHLATNPEEAATVFAQSPLEQARYFGRLEAKFSASQDAAPSNPPAGKPATAKTPQAPRPITTARGAGGKFQASASSEDFLAFEKVANNQ